MAAEKQDNAKKRARKNELMHWLYLKDDECTIVDDQIE